MSRTALNDLNYSFEPLTLFDPKQSKVIDERKLKESKEKNLQLIKMVKEYKDKMTLRQDQ